MQLTFTCLVNVKLIVKNIINIFLQIMFLFTFFTWLGTLWMISISYSAEKWSKLRFRNWSERCNSRRLRKSITRSIRSPKSSWTRIIWKGKKIKVFFIFLNCLKTIQLPNEISKILCGKPITINAIAPLYMYIHREPKIFKKVPVQKNLWNYLFQTVNHYMIPFFQYIKKLFSKKKKHSCM